ncbi:manganese-dependent inorganic pyrophosphatase [Streptobacillus moniliformis]|uniref:inorganic diphosphatase n=1 Tax=Streptobacillus moniliformis (strain ATCC 14647 / DSM 12112 / NCTC 10651 / 9901) TaxID=519441 RepID=D1AXI6_STRM9|nr:manganese-dependent inorganic pyrophosphatase [Streptobacillus moniliformis]ACZ01012.1 Inorganic diphosphatase [Streptobacillus moniliformis DSM 12112]AVL42616.1 manganese-dependent inorganic pyrophosphatase [Streptobacillus moniliformis]QXW65797.1 manganese-dependent inorganic pyrophosphatase [Streptobacillus moniliformis]SQA13849.1 Manganese-dependent inorganic pyrophosphatase [Streptobacillus moniliformis]
MIIFGHKNPDTDAICSAIVYSHLKEDLGIKAVAKRIGELNEETKFVLKYFGVDAPEYIDNVAGESIILVDHNERTQTADGFEEAKVLEVIDHHRVANFNVSDPLYMRVEAVGCTSTILFDMYRENNIKPCKIMAGLMLSAIISDTLLFKSPTCTPKDVIAGKELAKIAGLDLKEYGLEMLKAGTNLSSKTEMELLNMDMKIFEVEDIRMSIAQVNSVNEDEMLERKEKLLVEMKNLMEKEKVNFVMFVITNILTNDSVGLVSGNNLDVVEKAFNEKINDNMIVLRKVVSRKKQVVPPLTDAIKNR